MSFTNTIDVGGFASVQSQARNGTYIASTRTATRIWRSPDGSGLVTVNSKSTFPGPQDRRRWIAAGRPHRSPERHSSIHYTAARPVPFDQAGPHLDSVDQLPTGPAELNARLDEATNSSLTDEESTPERLIKKRFDLIRRLIIEPTCPAELRSSLFTLLSQSDGLAVKNGVPDPFGRVGAEVYLAGTAGDRTRIVLVFSPRSGRVLASGYQLAERSAKTDSEYSSYTAIKRDRFVDRVGQLP